MFWPIQPAAGRRAPRRVRVSLSKRAPAVRAVDQREVRVHHALGVAGGARGEEHRGHVVGPGPGHFGVEEAGVRASTRRPELDQLIQRLRGRARGSCAGRADRRTRCARAAGMRRGARAACRPVPGPRRSRSATSALLIGNDELGRGGVLVERHRHRAERLRREHRRRTGAAGCRRRPPGVGRAVNPASARPHGEVRAPVRRVRPS